MKKKKTSRQLLEELTYDRCDSCEERKQVVHFDRVTRTGRRVRAKRCTECYTGISRAA